MNRVSVALLLFLACLACCLLAAVDPGTFRESVMKWLILAILAVLFAIFLSVRLGQIGDGRSVRKERRDR